MQAGVQPADADDESQLPFTCTSVMEPTDFSPFTCSQLMEPGECVICMNPCAEFKHLCFTHDKHACDTCVSELHRRGLSCPVCRAALYVPPGKCTLCSKECTQFHALCLNHYTYACMNCVLELRRRNLHCPLCRAPLYEPGNPAYAWRERVAPVAARLPATLLSIAALYQEIEEIESRLAVPFIVE